MIIYLKKKEVTMTILSKKPKELRTFPNLLENFFPQDIFDWGQSNFSESGTTLPAVNIKETNENYEVEVAAPGMTKEDFKIELDGNFLTISSEKSESNTEGKKAKKLPEWNLIISPFKGFSIFQKMWSILKKYWPNMKMEFYTWLSLKRRKFKKNPYGTFQFHS